MGKHEEIEEGHYYEYDHNSGKHLLMKQREAGSGTPPKWSLRCILYNCVDSFLLLLYLAFFGGVGYLIYYIFNNYSGDN